MGNNNDLENSDKNCNEQANSPRKEEESKEKKFYQRIGDYITEKKDGLFEKIDIVQYAKTELEKLIDSKVPFITANIREETEKLIDHKLNDLYAFIKKITLLLFVLTLPLTVGVWAIAIAIYIK